MNLSDIQSGQLVKLTPKSDLYIVLISGVFTITEIIDCEAILCDGAGNTKGFYPDEIERV